MERKEHQARDWGLTIYVAPLSNSQQSLKILNLNLTFQVVMKVYFSKQEERTYFIFIYLLA